MRLVIGVTLLIIMKAAVPDPADIELSFDLVFESDDEKENFDDIVAPTEQTSMSYVMKKPAMRAFPVSRWAFHPCISFYEYLIYQGGQTHYESVRRLEADALKYIEYSFHGNILSQYLAVAYKEILPELRFFLWCEMVRKTSDPRKSKGRAFPRFEPFEALIAGLYILAFSRPLLSITGEQGNLEMRERVASAVFYLSRKTEKEIEWIRSYCDDLPPDECGSVVTALHILRGIALANAGDSKKTILEYLNGMEENLIPVEVSREVTLAILRYMRTEGTVINIIHEVMQALTKLRQP